MNPESDTEYGWYGETPSVSPAPTVSWATPPGVSSVPVAPPVTPPAPEVPELTTVFPASPVTRELTPPKPKTRTKQRRVSTPPKKHKRQNNKNGVTPEQGTTASTSGQQTPPPPPKPKRKPSPERVWHWEAINPLTGTTERGELNGVDEVSVRVRLRDAGYENAKLKRGRKVDSLGGEKILGRRASQDATSEFLSNFASMLDAGVGLNEAFATVLEDDMERFLASAINEAATDVMNGSAVSHAFAKHPGVFPPTAIALIRAGEAHGEISGACAAASAMIARQARIKRLIRSALRGPLITLGASLLIAAALIIFVVPQFATMYQSSGAHLPWPTQFLVDLADTAVIWGPALAAITAIAVFGYRAARRNRNARKRIDKTKLRLPKLGRLFELAAIARFADVFAQTSAAGVRLHEAITLAGEASGNEALNIASHDIATRASSGEPLSSSFARHTDVFPRRLIAAVRAGEMTGNLDKSLSKIAVDYNDRLDIAVAAMPETITPIATLVLGGMIGPLLIALYLPLFQMAQTIGGTTEKAATTNMPR